MYRYFLTRVVLPTADRLLGLSIQKDLELLKKIQWYTVEELATGQKEKLRNILIHCSLKIPYYSARCIDIGFNADDDPETSLKKFPLLDKDLIRANLPDRILDRDRGIYFTDYTSGSSGVQGIFHSDRPAYSVAVAIQMLWWQWAGYGFGDKTFQLGITPERGFVKSVKDRLLRVKYSQAFQINEKTVCDNLESLGSCGDVFFMGYPSALYEYAKIAAEKGYDDISFRSVVSWGDKMFPHYRSLIEKQFSSEVFDTYGTCENTMIAAECEHHNYHIMQPHIYLEILDEKGNEVPPGKMGQVVVTRLDNYLMPLIRYKLGDLAVKSATGKKCPCGRQLPMLERIIGRDTDIVYTPGGQSLIVHFFTGIFEFLEEIRQFQVVQNSLDDIVINYIPARGFGDETLDKIKAIIYAKANESFVFRFVEVSRIDATASGKPQIIVSNMPLKS